MPLVCGVALNSGCRLCTRCCCFSVSGGAVVERAGLHHEPAHDAVERRPVENAGLGQLQEVAHVLGRLVRVEADRHRAERRLEHGLVLLELLRGLACERHRRGRRRVADRHRRDDDTLERDIPVAGRGHARDLVDDLHPFAHAAKQRVLAGQRRLVGDAHEELRSRAVGLPGPQRRADGTARERLGVHLGANHPEAPRPVLRGLGWILRQRIATLDERIRDHAMEQRVRKRAIRRQLHEIPDVVRRQIRPQVDDERPQRGLDDGLFARHLLDAERRLVEPLRGRTLQRLPRKSCDEQGQQIRHRHNLLIIGPTGPGQGGRCQERTSPRTWRGGPPAAAGC